MIDAYTSSVCGTFTRSTGIVGVEEKGVLDRLPQLRERK